MTPNHQDFPLGSRVSFKRADDLFRGTIIGIAAVEDTADFGVHFKYIVHLDEGQSVPTLRGEAFGAVVSGLELSVVQ
jgi:hypothetical protein